MLLAIDVGNTQTVFGLFDGDRLTEQFRVGTDRSHTGDELAVMLRAFVDLERARRDRALRVGADARPRVRGVRRALGRDRAARARAGRVDGRADPLRRPARGRPGPDRERRRRARAPRRAGGRRRLRHVDELRRRQRGGRVRGRRARAGHRDLDGRAVRARRAAAEGAVHRARARDQPDDDGRAPVGPRLRLRRPGRRDRRRASSPSSAPRARRSSRPAASPT